MVPDLSVRIQVLVEIGRPVGELPPPQARGASGDLNRATVDAATAATYCDQKSHRSGTARTSPPVLAYAACGPLPKSSWGTAATPWQD